MTKKRNKHYESISRQITLSLLSDWFEIEVHCRRASYAKDKKKRVVDLDIPEERVREIDPLAQAKRDRPELWNTKFKRRYKTTDHMGNEVEREEELSILDVFGPGPKETRQIPNEYRPRQSMRTEEASSRAARARDKHATWHYTQRLGRLQRGMGWLRKCHPIAAMCIRLYEAGHSQTSIAKQLNCDKSVIRDCYEYAIGFLDFCVFANPVYREDLSEFRQVLKEHLRRDHLTKMTAKDLFGHDGKLRKRKRWWENVKQTDGAESPPQRESPTWC